MSLFPAFSSLGKDTNAELATNAASTSKQDGNDAWLSNPSFQLPPSAATETNMETVEVSDNQSNDGDASSHSHSAKKAKKHSKKKKKKEHKRHKEKDTKSPPKSEFTGKEDYYVDKRADKTFFTKSSINKEDYARYRVRCHRLGDLTSQQLLLLRRQSRDKLKRYFNRKQKIEKVQEPQEADAVDRESKATRLTEDEFTIRTKAFNRSLGSNPGDVSTWLDFVHFQQHFYMKMTKLQMAERKMEILNKALKSNPANDQLYTEYVDIIEQTYPSFEVSKILEDLLQKDPINYILWNAQIMATQGSMARCKVPEVLELYEKCMKNMYKRNRCDQVTLRLFNSCALFLRQTGLYEQFFALITLALELNVSENKFCEIQINESEQNTLIEYEEIVLKSGLPLNEIWLRIEKLRQNYYFLPCPANRSCSDPQRIVLNEDIYHYIYPLSNREHAFNLVIIVLKLLKIPLVDNCRLKQSTFSMAYGSVARDNLCDFDSIEDITPIFLYRTIFPTSSPVDDILWLMVRDFSIGPTFVTTHIGYELYVKYLSEVLLLCGECFRDPNASSSKANIFILLWLRLERVIMATDVYLHKWSDEKAKKLRTKIKNLLKRDENRNCLLFYVEFAQIECDLMRVEQAENIFVSAINQSDPTVDDDCTRTEYWYTCVSFAEMLMRNGQPKKALNALIALALRKKIDTGTVSEANKLLALKKLNDHLKDLTFIERNVTIMEIEQSLLPDYLICVIKANVYYLILTKATKDEAKKQLEVLLKTFPDKNLRHEFIRESLYELYVSVMLYKSNCDTNQNTFYSEPQLFSVISRGLEQFPTNLYLLKCAVLCDDQPWYRLRTLLTKHNAPVAIIFLVACAQYRCKKYTSSLLESNGKTSTFYGLSADIGDIESTYKVRVANLLHNVTDHEAPTRKNSLLWRLHLRSLLDVTSDFEKSQNVLLTALNECPWNKTLYLDGSVYVPQELAHLQDLIIEKQLRIYAMPEELEILRNFDGTQ